MQSSNHGNHGNHAAATKSRKVSFSSRPAEVIASEIRCCQAIEESNGALNTQHRFATATTTTATSKDMPTDDAVFCEDPNYDSEHDEDGNLHQVHQKHYKKHHQASKQTAKISQYLSSDENEEHSTEDESFKIRKEILDGTIRKKTLDETVHKEVMEQGGKIRISTRRIIRKVRVLSDVEYQVVEHLKEIVDEGLRRYEEYIDSDIELDSEFVYKKNVDEVSYDALGSVGSNTSDDQGTSCDDENMVDKRDLTDVEGSYSTTRTAAYINSLDMESSALYTSEEHLNITGSEEISRKRPSEDDNKNHNDQDGFVDRSNIVIDIHGKHPKLESSSTGELFSNRNGNYKDNRTSFDDGDGMKETNNMVLNIESSKSKANSHHQEPRTEESVANINIDDSHNKNKSLSHNSSTTSTHIELQNEYNTIEAVFTPTSTRKSKVNIGEGKPTQAPSNDIAHKIVESIPNSLLTASSDCASQVKQSIRKRNIDEKSNDNDQENVEAASKKDVLKRYKTGTTSINDSVPIKQKTPVAEEYIEAPVEVEVVNASPDLIPEDTESKHTFGRRSGDVETNASVEVRDDVEFSDSHAVVISTTGLSGRDRPERLSASDNTQSQIAAIDKTITTPESTDSARSTTLNAQKQHQTTTSSNKTTAANDKQDVLQGSSNAASNAQKQHQTAPSSNKENQTATSSNIEKAASNKKNMFQSDTKDPELTQHTLFQKRQQRSQRPPASKSNSGLGRRGQHSNNSEQVLPEKTTDDTPTTNQPQDVQQTKKTPKKSEESMVPATGKVEKTSSSSKSAKKEAAKENSCTRLQKNTTDTPDEKHAKDDGVTFALKSSGSEPKEKTLEKTRSTCLQKNAAETVTPGEKQIKEDGVTFTLESSGSTAEKPDGPSRPLRRQRRGRQRDFMKVVPTTSVKPLKSIEILRQSPSPQPEKDDFGDDTLFKQPLASNKVLQQSSSSTQSEKDDAEDNKPVKLLTSNKTLPQSQSLQPEKDDAGIDKPVKPLMTNTTLQQSSSSPQPENGDVDDDLLDQPASQQNVKVTSDDESTSLVRSNEALRRSSSDQQQDIQDTESHKLYQLSKTIDTRSPILNQQAVDDVEYNKFTKMLKSPDASRQQQRRSQENDNNDEFKSVKLLKTRETLRRNPSKQNGEKQQANDDTHLTPIEMTKTLQKPPPQQQCQQLPQHVVNTSDADFVTSESFESEMKQNAKEVTSPQRDIKIEGQMHQKAPLKTRNPLASTSPLDKRQQNTSTTIPGIPDKKVITDATKNANKQEEVTKEAKEYLKNVKGSIRRKASGENSPTKDDNVTQDVETALQNIEASAPKKEPVEIIGKLSKPKDCVLVSTSSDNALSIPATSEKLPKLTTTSEDNNKNSKSTEANNDKKFYHKQPKPEAVYDAIMLETSQKEEEKSGAPQKETTQEVAEKRHHNRFMLKQDSSNEPPNNKENIKNNTSEIVSQKEKITSEVVQRETTQESAKKRHCNRFKTNREPSKEPDNEKERVILDNIDDGKNHASQKEKEISTKVRKDTAQELSRRQSKQIQRKKEPQTEAISKTEGLVHYKDDGKKKVELQKEKDKSNAFQVQTAQEIPKRRNNRFTSKKEPRQLPVDSKEDDIVPVETRETESQPDMETDEGEKFLLAIESNKSVTGRSNKESTADPSKTTSGYNNGKPEDVVTSKTTFDGEQLTTVSSKETKHTFQPYSSSTDQRDFKHSTDGKPLGTLDQLKLSKENLDIAQQMENILSGIDIALADHGSSYNSADHQRLSESGTYYTENIDSHLQGLVSTIDKFIQEDDNKFTRSYEARKKSNKQMEELKGNKEFNPVHKVEEEYDKFSPYSLIRRKKKQNKEARESAVHKNISVYNVGNEEYAENIDDTFCVIDINDAGSITSDVMVHDVASTLTSPPMKTKTARTSVIQNMEKADKGNAGCKRDTTTQPMVNSAFQANHARRETAKTNQTKTTNNEKREENTFLANASLEKTKDVNELLAKDLGKQEDIEEIIMPSFEREVEVEPDSIFRIAANTHLEKNAGTPKTDVHESAMKNTDDTDTITVHTGTEWNNFPSKDREFVTNRGAIPSKFKEKTKHVDNSSTKQQDTPKQIGDKRDKNDRFAPKKQLANQITEKTAKKKEDTSKQESYTLDNDESFSTKRQEEEQKVKSLKKEAAASKQEQQDMSQNEYKSSASKKQDSVQITDQTSKKEDASKQEKEKPDQDKYESFTPYTLVKRRKKQDTTLPQKQITTENAGTEAFADQIFLDDTFCVIDLDGSTVESVNSKEVFKVNKTAERESIEYISQKASKSKEDAALSDSKGTNTREGGLTPSNTTITDTNTEIEATEEIGSPTKRRKNNRFTRQRPQQSSQQEPQLTDKNRSNSNHHYNNSNSSNSNIGVNILDEDTNSISVPSATTMSKNKTDAQRQSTTLEIEEVTSNKGLVPEYAAQHVNKIESEEILDNESIEITKQVTTKKGLFPEQTLRDISNIQYENAAENDNIQVGGHLSSTKRLTAKKGLLPEDAVQHTSSIESKEVLSTVDRNTVRQVKAKDSVVKKTKVTTNSLSKQQHEAVPFSNAREELSANDDFVIIPEIVTTTTRKIAKRNAFLQNTEKHGYKSGSINLDASSEVLDVPTSEITSSGLHITSTQHSRRDTEACDKKKQLAAPDNGKKRRKDNEKEEELNVSKEEISLVRVVSSNSTSILETPQAFLIEENIDISHTSQNVRDQVSHNLDSNGMESEHELNDKTKTISTPDKVFTKLKEDRETVVKNTERLTATATAARTTTTTTATTATTTLERSTATTTTAATSTTSPTTTLVSFTDLLIDEKTKDQLEVSSDISVASADKLGEPLHSNNKNSQKTSVKTSPEKIIGLSFNEVDQQRSKTLGNTNNAKATSKTTSTSGKIELTNDKNQHSDTRGRLTTLSGREVLLKNESQGNQQSEETPRYNNHNNTTSVTTSSSNKKELFINKELPQQHLIVEETIDPICIVKTESVPSAQHDNTILSSDANLCVNSTRNVGISNQALETNVVDKNGETHNLATKDIRDANRNDKAREANSSAPTEVNQNTNKVKKNGLNSHKNNKDITAISGYTTEKYQQKDADLQREKVNKVTASCTNSSTTPTDRKQSRAEVTSSETEPASTPVSNKRHQDGKASDSTSSIISTTQRESSPSLTTTANTTAQAERNISSLPSEATAVSSSKKHTPQKEKPKKKVLRIKSIVNKETGADINLKDYLLSHQDSIFSVRQGDEVAEEDKQGSSRVVNNKMAKVDSGTSRNAELVIKPINNGHVSNSINDVIKLKGEICDVDELATKHQQQQDSTTMTKNSERNEILAVIHDLDDDGVNKDGVTSNGEGCRSPASSEVSIVFPQGHSPRRTISFIFKDAETNKTNHYNTQIDIAASSPTSSDGDLHSPRHVSFLSVDDSELSSTSPRSPSRENHGSFLSVADLPESMQKDITTLNNGHLDDAQQQQKWQYKLRDTKNDGGSCHLSIQVVLDPNVAERFETETFEYQYLANESRTYGCVGDWVLVNCTRSEIEIFIELLREIIERELNNPRQPDDTKKLKDAKFCYIL